MSRPLCEDHENVLRAINETHWHWDGNKNRLSSSLFTGANTSLSRLSILNKAEIFAIFKKELKCKVISAGEINVGALMQIGQNHNVEITVEQDPLPTNPAHAEIPQKISRKIAFKIIDLMTIHLLEP